jgi:hypothetical protein
MRFLSTTRSKNLLSVFCCSLGIAHFCRLKILATRPPDPRDITKLSLSHSGMPPRAHSSTDYRSSTDSSPLHNDLLSANHRVLSDPGGVEPNTSAFLRTHSTSLRFRSSSSVFSGKEQHNYVFLKKIKAVMYNFGSPKVGNFGFKLLYDKIVPNSFRVVIDGDLVVGLPPQGYDHIGTEILLDSLGAGSIIIDPSFVEKWLRTHMKSSVTVHSLLYYRKGLLGLKLAAEYLKKYADEIKQEDRDPLKLVVQLRDSHKIEKLVALHQDLPAILATIQEEGDGEGEGEESFHEQKKTRSVSDQVPTEEISVDQNRIALRFLHEEGVSPVVSSPVSVDISSPAVHSAPLTTAVSPSHSVAGKPVNIGEYAPSSLEKFSSGRTPVSFEMVSPSLPQAAETEPTTSEKLDQQHYEHDVRNMNDLLAQIKSVKRFDTVEEWLKKNTIQRFKKKKPVEVTGSVNSAPVIVGSQTIRQMNNSVGGNNYSRDGNSDRSGISPSIDRTSMQSLKKRNSNNLIKDDADLSSSPKDSNV